jgi:hypothetical protein
MDAEPVIPPVDFNAEPDASSSDFAELILNSMKSEGEPIAKNTNFDSAFSPVEKPVDIVAPADPVVSDSEVSKIEEPVFKDQSTKKGWDALKDKAFSLERSNREFQDKAKALEDKISKLDDAGANTSVLEDRLQKLTEENQKYMKLVRQVNVQADPEFQKIFVDGKNDLINRAKELGERFGVDAEEIETALSYTGDLRQTALQEIAEQLPNYNQGIFGGLIQNIEELETQAAQEIDEPQRFMEYSRQEQERKNKEESDSVRQEAEQSWERVSSRTAQDLQSLAKIDPLTNWGEKASQILEKARADFSSQKSFDESADIIIRANMAAEFQQLYKVHSEKSSRLEKENESLKSELKKVFATTPSIPTHSSPRSASGGFQDFASIAFNGLG